VSEFKASVRERFPDWHDSVTWSPATRSIPTIHAMILAKSPGDPDIVNAAMKRNSPPGLREYLAFYPDRVDTIEVGVDG